MNEIILMAHVLFGVACLVTAAWLFVDVLHANETNLVRIRRMSWGAWLPSLMKPWRAWRTLLQSFVVLPPMPRTSCARL